ncbi:MAG: HEAT repeat domain-containing protein [Planctomycetes bacterium]|nr:HEAT repeat domain-containing protein [Planctomycetota bacterium]
MRSRRAGALLVLVPVLSVAGWTRVEAQNPTPAPAPAPAQAARPSIDTEVEKLFGRVLGDDPLVANEAREELLDLGRGATPALVRVLKDTSPQKRYIACELLAELRDPAALPGLMELLKDLDAYQASVASAAARAIGRLGDASAVPALLEALGSKDVDLRYEAVRALGNLRAVQAVPKLIDLVKNDKGQTFHERLVSCGAAQALGRLGAREAVPELILLLDSYAKEPSSDNGINYYAVRALERVTGEEKGSLTTTAEAMGETIKKWKAWWDTHKAEFGGAGAPGNPGAGEKKPDAPAGGSPPADPKAADPGAQAPK